MKTLYSVPLAAILSFSAPAVMAQTPSPAKNAGAMHGADPKQMDQRFEHMNDVMARAGHAQGGQRMELMQQHMQMMLDQMQAMHSMMQGMHGSMMMGGKGNSGDATDGSSTMNGDMQNRMDMLQSRMNMMQMMMEQMLEHQAMAQQGGN